jgi:hypothetical protein
MKCEKCKDIVRCEDCGSIITICECPCHRGNIMTGTGYCCECTRPKPDYTTAPKYKDITY